MAAIDFPNSPSVGQQFTAGNGTVYQWNGTLWLVVGSGVTASAVRGQLGGNVAFTVADTYVNGPNTGSIGAAGQKWLVEGTAYFDCVTGGSEFFVAQIWNGAAEMTSAVVTSSGGLKGVATIKAIVTLAAATTFTLRGKNSSSGSGDLNFDSYIVAMRIA